MSNFDLTFCKVYVYAKGWPGINLGASHESGTHPTTEVISNLTRGVTTSLKLRGQRKNWGAQK